MVHPRTAWRWIQVVLSCALLLGLLTASTAAISTLNLRADPDRLPADGSSQAVIVVEITDANGVPAPDGTVVRFMTTLGKVVSPVQTVGGLAQTSLTASRTAGTAVISAIAGSSRETIDVTFTPMPGSTAPGARSVELTADEISYSSNLCLFVATWNAKLHFGTITLQADGLQYEIANNTVRAQGNVVLKAGTKELRADALRYDVLSLYGRLIQLTDGGGTRLIVEGDQLATRPDDSQEEALWQPLKTEETRTWVKCTRAVVDPGDKIILDHASVYVDDIKLFNLRRHVMAPKPTPALLGNVFGFSSSNGMSVDYPYYYRASANHIGTLHLRRNASTGSYWNPGWLLGWSEEYVREGKMEGSFSLDDLLHPSNGFHWQHQQRFAGGLSVDTDYSSLTVEGATHSYRTAGFNAFRPLGNGSMSLVLGKSNYGQSKEQFADIGYRAASFPIAKGISATPSFHLRQSEREVVTQDIIIDPDTGEPLTFDNTTTGRTTATGLELGMMFRPREIGKLTLTGALSTGYTWLLSGGNGQPLFNTRWTLDRRFRNNGYVGLSLNYSTQTVGMTSGLLRTGQKSLSLSARGKVKNAMVGLRVTQDLDGERRYGSFNFHQPLNFGKDALGQPLWSIDAYHMFSQFNNFQAQNSVFSLNRLIGRYSLSLKYSPQGGGSYSSNRPWLSPWGFGYTYSGDNHLWLEFSASTE